MNTNPYQPTLSGTTKPLKGIPWFRRFAILNGVLFSVPVVCALAAYFVLSANVICGDHRIRIRTGIGVG